MNLSIPAQPHTTTSHAVTPGQTVLLVEDSGTFGSLVWCQLTALGYHVLTASGGAEALEILTRFGASSIDLLIAEMDMPLMRGDELAEWFHKANPEAKVLLMSTCADTVKPGKKTGLLQKPFQIETLGEQVREFLDSDPETAQKKAA